MSVIRSKRIPGLAGEYNFANDPALGAIGNVLLQVYIPFKSLITGFFGITIAAPASALGLAQISFGHRNENGTIVVDSLMVATPLAAFTVRNAAGAFGPGQGVDLRANPLSFAEQVTVQVIMAISVEPLTAGRIAFKVEADSFDI